MQATLRYLPKYLPDLNPIEMPYSKFKQFLRKVAARTVPGINSSHSLVHPTTQPSRIPHSTISGMQAMLQYDRNPL